MGRPIKKSFFGNLASQGGTGGEGVASVTNPAGTLGTLVNGTYAIPPASITAPQVTGGIKPVLSVVVTGATAYTVVVVSSGAGYTSAPTITFAGTVAGGTGTASPVATLTATRANAISFASSFTGFAAVTTGDIIKQDGSKTYLVRNSVNGGTTGTCLLVATATTFLRANQMNILATDNLNSTYYVLKLTGRKAILVRNSNGGSGYVFENNGAAKWTTGTAVAAVGASAAVVSIASV